MQEFTLTAQPKAGHHPIKNILNTFQYGYNKQVTGMDTTLKKQLNANIWKFYLYKYLRGLWIPATIWTLYLIARGFDYTQIGITDIVFSAVLLLLEIPSGAFADLIGRKWSVFLGYAVVGLAVLLIGMTGNYSLVLIILALYGIGETLYSGADDALFYDSLKELKKEHLYPKINGRSGAIFSIGSISGGFVGAYLFTINISYPYYLGAAVFFLAGVSFLLMKETKKREKYSMRAHYNQVIEGCRYVKGHPQVRWIIAYSALFAAFFGYQIFIVQPSLVEFGFDVKNFGFLFALIWGFEAMVYWNAHRLLDWLGEKRTLFSITFIHISCFIILSLIDAWFGLIFIIVNYFGRGLSYPVTNNFIQKHIMSSHRATALSVQNFVVSLVYIVSIFVFSRLTDLLSISSVYFIVGLSAALSAIIL